MKKTQRLTMSAGKTLRQVGYPSDALFRKVTTSDMDAAQVIAVDCTSASTTRHTCVWLLCVLRRARAWFVSESRLMRSTRARMQTGQRGRMSSVSVSVGERLCGGVAGSMGRAGDL